MIEVDGGKIHSSENSAINLKLNWERDIWDLDDDTVDWYARMCSRLNYRCWTDELNARRLRRPTRYVTCCRPVSVRLATAGAAQKPGVPYSAGGCLTPSRPESRRPPPPPLGAP